jgi:tryptophan synthase alpha chain
MPTTNKSVIQQATTTIPPATRITQAFARAKREGRGALIPYFMCGYPSAAQSIEIVVAAAESGADIIELGMPFSDPLADGATIQHAGHVALQRGMTINGCMEVARQVAARTHVPLLLMGYYNPVLSYGLERFCATARASGICGLIIPDLPPEEAAPLREAAQRNGLAMIFLVPPTTPNERIQHIVDLMLNGLGGFVYCVSLSGVTGSRKELPANLRSFIERVHGYTKDRIPVAVGFGLSTPAHIAEVTHYADGAAIGSALVNLIDNYSETGGAEQIEAIRHYIQSLAQK